MLERNPRYLGGKARSVDAPAPTASTPSCSCPASMAFAFSGLLPACHRHHARIPLGNGLSVYDNLVCTQDMMMTQTNAKPVVLP